MNKTLEIAFSLKNTYRVSGTYRIVLSATYLVCFWLMNLRMPILIFGIMTIVFCVLYSIVASIFIYKLAPRTFRIRV